ncbi:hypothetical protein [Dinghuibacter silviterrae]|uniref:Lipoprotein n=1 Tax=Dinghuibacter silviterrae TaxID=1539049 RepID=A0A4R8DUU4_9BACT|nr:hypothetical protein [Dinghuibacter silviterrae]TDX02172.1 hypothetical protein EDB95_3222 [Dinghuibacter silviterrae]
MNKCFGIFIRIKAVHGLLLSFVIVAVTSVMGCHKSGSDTSQCNNFEVPDPLILELKENGQYITDSAFLAKIKMSYTSGSSKQYVSDLSVSDGMPESDGIRHFVMTTSVAPLYSAQSGIKTYTLEYPDGSASDVVYVDMERSLATNCQFRMQSLLIDGRRPQTDSLILGGGYDSTYVVVHL